MTDSIPWPYVVDHEQKLVKVYVESGWPTVLGVPQVIGRKYPGYAIGIVKEDPTK